MVVSTEFKEIFLLVLALLESEKKNYMVLFFEILCMGPIVYFFDGRSPSRHRQCLFTTGALMEHFLDGIAPLRHWHINPNEKSKAYKSSLLS